MRSLVSWHKHHKHDQSWSKYISITEFQVGFSDSPEFLLPHWTIRQTFLRCNISINKTRTTGYGGVLQLQKGLSITHEALRSNPCAAQANHTGVCL